MQAEEKIILDHIAAQNVYIISHSGADTRVARKLSDQCRALGATTFLDQTEIEIGSKFETDILTTLRKSDELLVLLTPWALDPLMYGWRLVPRGIAIKQRNIINLNDVGRYFEQLQKRITSSHIAISTS